MKEDKDMELQVCKHFANGVCPPNFTVHEGQYILCSKCQAHLRWVTQRNGLKVLEYFNDVPEGWEVHPMSAKSFVEVLSEQIFGV